MLNTAQLLTPCNSPLQYSLCTDTSPPPFCMLCVLLLFPGWTENAEERPTFMDLVFAFTKMAVEPRHYLRVVVCVSDLHWFDALAVYLCQTEGTQAREWQRTKYVVIEFSRVQVQVLALELLLVHSSVCRIVYNNVGNLESPSLPRLQQTASELWWLSGK